MIEREVRDSIRFWEKQVASVLVIFTVVWLGISVIFLWGLRDLRFATAWSLGALAYSTWLFFRGWRPWRSGCMSSIGEGEYPKMTMWASKASSSGT